MIILSAILTECDLSLHGHGECGVLDLAAEERVVVQLGVEAPGEHGVHLHGAVRQLHACVVEVVERVRALHPARELAADHRLGDDLGGGGAAVLQTRVHDVPGGTTLTTHATTAVTITTTTTVRRGDTAWGGGAIHVQPHRLPVLVHQGHGLLDLGVVQVSADEGPHVLV